MVEKCSSFPLNKTLLICLALLAFAAPSLCAADDWKYEETRHDAREFVAAGTIHVRMTVGDLHIKRGDSNQIRLEYTVKSKHESSVKKTTVEFDVHGKDADIEFHSPSGRNTNFDFELEVQENSNLYLHEKVADFTE